MPPTPTRSPAATAAVLPESPPGDVTAGLDWATADHAVAIVNHKGTITEQFLIDATGAGLRELVRRLRRAGVGEVAIERGDGQVVDTLLDAGLTVVVISPNQVHNLRGRYARRGIRTTGSTRSCWPTPCAPTVLGARSSRTPRPPR